MSKKYVEFKKITDDSENNYYEHEIEDSIYSENVQYVLKTYNIDYKIADGKILIPKSIYKDKEYCKNLSNKASDPEWLKSRKQQEADLEQP